MYSGLSSAVAGERSWKPAVFLQDLLRVYGSERWITWLAGRGRPRRTARRNVNRRTNRSSTSRTHMVPAENYSTGSSVPGSDNKRYRRACLDGLRDARRGRTGLVSASGFAVRACGVASDTQHGGFSRSSDTSGGTSTRQQTVRARRGIGSLERVRPFASSRGIRSLATAFNRRARRYQPGCISYGLVARPRQEGRSEEKTTVSTWNRARAPAELKHIIERRKRKPKGIPPVTASEKGKAKRRTRDPNGSAGM